MACAAALWRRDAGRFHLQAGAQLLQFRSGWALERAALHEVGEQCGGNAFAAGLQRIADRRNGIGFQLGGEARSPRPGPLRRQRMPVRVVAAPAVAESGCAAAAAGRGVRTSARRHPGWPARRRAAAAGSQLRSSVSRPQSARAGSRTRRSRYSPSIMCWRCAARSCSPRISTRSGLTRGSKPSSSRRM